MSNEKVLKPFFTLFENESGESREIDSNQLVDERIQEFRRKEEENRRKKEQEMLDNMTPEEREEYENENKDNDELAALFQNQDEEFDDSIMPSTDMAIPNDLVEKAQEEAGYDMGQAMAANDLEAAKAEMQEEIEKIRQEYVDKEVDMEKEVLDVVCDVMSKVFMIEFSDKKEILLHLCENAITNSESSKTLLIRVNERNKSYLEENKDMLQDKVGEGVQLDIIMDPLLEDDKCIIECDGGIIDCSIGVELDNFIKDLRALTI